ncbi:apoptosis regulatory protein Siva-like [Halichondria panicea]|uniref:apoptosis regulatory protein Siva-like n=1 Tax=Halichondria panicea TaxID=6063 RepID=UPI00312BBE45
MPKRKNPFGESAPIQLKTHVGFNQAATIADKQAVYERTKALLFNGSNPGIRGVENVPPHMNRLFDDCAPLPMAEAMDTPPVLPPSPQQQGILQYFTNGGDIKVTATGPTLACGSCHCAAGVELVMVCVGCGRRVCGGEGCLRECLECQRPLCQFCTVLNYNTRDVRTFCFDCLPVINCS